MKQAVWSEELREALALKLKAANGRRQARVLTMASLEALVKTALDSELGYAVTTGGEGDATEHTTLALAVAHGETVTVGVATVRAAGASPERAWAELAGWDRFSPGANLTRVHRWAVLPRDDRLVLPSESEARALPTDEALLQAVVESPNDLTPRQVLADLWSERGDPRGELVASQLALERADLAAGTRAQLSQRCAALISEHEREWLGEVATHLRATWRRGFVEAVTILDDRALIEQPAFFERHPITSLTFARLSAVEVPRLAAFAPLRRLEHLGFDFPPSPRAQRRLGARELSALLESRLLRGTRSLSLENHPLGRAGAEQLAGHLRSAMPRLERLRLVACELDASAVAALAQAPWLKALLELDLSRNQLKTQGVEALVGGTRPLSLKVLRLERCGLRNDAGLALARSTQLPSLQRVGLSHNDIAPTGARALLDRSSWEVELEANPIGKQQRERLSRRTEGS